MRVFDDVLSAEGEDAVSGVVAEGAALLEDGLPAGEERLPARVDDGQVALLVADDRLQVVALPAARGVRGGEEAAEGARQLVLRGLAEALVVDADSVEVAAPRRIEGHQAELVVYDLGYAGLIDLTLVGTSLLQRVQKFPRQVMCPFSQLYVDGS